MTSTDKSDVELAWELCPTPDCRGAVLSGYGKCLGHLDAPELDKELARFGSEGTLNARGVCFSSGLLARILAAAPRDADGLPQLWQPSFERATFGDKVSFGRAVFGEGTSFAGAKFREEVSFVQAKFGKETSFAGTTFGHQVSFASAKFEEEANFTEATFGPAIFRGATFGDWAKFTEATFGVIFFSMATFGYQTSFSGATFKRWADFAGATFQPNADFGGAKFVGEGTSFVQAKFEEDASFIGATFGDGASFAGATFGDGASFAGATFGDRAMLGPLLVTGSLSLANITLGRAPHIEITSREVNGRGARFPHGMTMRLAWADVYLDEAEFGGPSIIAQAFKGNDERAVFSWLDAARAPFAAQPPPPSYEIARLWGPEWRAARPRLLSLAGADVANLTLSGVDLRACRFADAYHLDQLTIEGAYPFADCPSGWRAGWGWPPLWKWTPRRILAEEHRWRAAVERGIRQRGWFPVECRLSIDETAELPGDSEQEWRKQAREISQLYRTLRKGQEDRKDEPGAADFYYGEMELRRQGTARPSFERALLWLYWLFSGYALRASRALLALLVVLATATGMIAAVGFPPPKPETTLTATIVGVPPRQSVRLQPHSTTTVTTNKQAFGARLGTAALIALEGAVFRASEQQLTYKRTFRNLGWVGWCDDPGP